MKFTVDLVNKSGRLGVLSKADFKMKTPAFVMTTKGGSLPYISREVLDLALTPEEQSSQMLSVDLQTTLEMADSLKSFKKGLSSFVGLSHIPCLLHVQDWTVESRQHHDVTGVPVFAKSGKKVLNSNDFMEIVDSMIPDMCILLGDSVTDFESGKNRCSKSVKKTRELVEECLKLKKPSHEWFVVAPVVGGFQEFQRNDYLDFLTELKGIDGYSLEGFHKLGASAMTANPAEISKMVDMCQEKLPREKLKIMLGAYMPSHVLDLVAKGIDIFDNSLPYLFAEAQNALIFNFDIKNSSKTRPFLSIDVSDNRFKNVFEPILAECECLACRKHTLAYIHHLFDSRELLGSILLILHNFHHYHQFFKSIQSHVKSDSLLELQLLIKEQSNEKDVQELCLKLAKKCENKSDGMLLKKQ